jgi:hypothetical protein
MLHQLLQQKQNYALILLLFALLAYSLIGFSIDVPVARAQEPPSEQAAPFVQGSVGQRSDGLVLTNASLPLR